MISKASSTADATSKVADRFNVAVSEAYKNIGAVRQERVREVQKKVENLKLRGLLRRQEYSEATAADFQGLLLSAKNA